MLLLALLGLAPFLFFPFTLGLRLSLTDENSERPPNSNVGITWTQTSPSDPSPFTLRLTSPDGENMWEAVEDHTSGQVQMGVGRAGNYIVTAIDLPKNKILAQLPFNVGAASTSTVSTTQTSSSSPPSTSPSPPTSESHTQDQTTETYDPSTSESTAVNSTTTGSTASPNGSSMLQSDNNGSSSPHLPPALTNSPTPTYSPGDTNTYPAYPTITSSLPSTSPTSSPSSSSKRGTILGAVLGSLAFLIILVIIFLLWRRRRQKQERRIIFHKDMMVRSPGPSLFALSHAASSDERRMNPILGSMEQKSYVTVLSEPLDAAISDSLHTSQESGVSELASSRPFAMLTRKESDPFRDI